MCKAGSVITDKFGAMGTRARKDPKERALPSVSHNTPLNNHRGYVLARPLTQR